MRPYLIVIRADDVDSLADFYTILGCKFVKHCHGQGSEHYAYETDDGFVFEIYPRLKEPQSTIGVRLGFQVASVDEVIHRMQADGRGEVIAKPADLPWGRRAVIDDPEGHRVELLQAILPGASRTKLNG
ncbi:MAG: VOC family protein [Cyanobacteria bacterium J06635_15]